MKIGIMGASFDPPHKAHFAVAAEAFRFLGLNKIIFVCANSSPLKSHDHFASFADRLSMLKLALENFSYPFEISEIEERRGGKSYSVDTARELKSQNPQAEFYWIIGTDQLLQLHKWERIEELGKLVSFAVFERPNFAFEIPKNIEKKVSVKKIQFSPMEISSTKVREAVKNRQMALDLIEQKVLNYIDEKKLYKNG